MDKSQVTRSIKFYAIGVGVIIAAGAAVSYFHLARNSETSSPISTADSPCVIQVLPSQEDEQIARHTLSLMTSSIV